MDTLQFIVDFSYDGYYHHANENQKLTCIKTGNKVVIKGKIVNDALEEAMYGYIFTLQEGFCPLKEISTEIFDAKGQKIPCTIRSTGEVFITINNYEKQEFIFSVEFEAQ